MLTQFSDTHLSHSVLSRLADAYFSQGDSARGFAAFDCLRAGLLLDAGVVRYIDSAADSDSNVLEVDLGACELADSVATLQSTEFDILRKKRFIRRAPFVRCNDYYCAFLAFRDGQAGQDIGRCREHLVQLLRRMRADKLSPDVQMLKRIMVENLHVDVSLEATLLYHDWLLAILRSLANRCIKDLSWTI